MNTKRLDPQFHLFAWRKYLDMWIAGEIDSVDFLAREIGLHAGCYWDDLSDEDKQAVYGIARDAMTNAAST